VNHKLDTDSRVFFYEQDFYVLSNFSAFRVIYGGSDYDTAEHAYHAQKFPNAPSIRNEIRCARSAHDAFKIAQASAYAVVANWNERRVDIMRCILCAKVEQHEYVRRKLLATGDRELIEDSWRDNFWGWGPNRDGVNMLGKLWMQVRAQLRDAE
jgi:ribA/ribD-fused uncharacterized protein